MDQGDKGNKGNKTVRYDMVTWILAGILVRYLCPTIPGIPMMIGSMVDRMGPAREMIPWIWLVSGTEFN